MYANVIVDISHEKLDKTFQYLVPAGLENEIEPGVCVEIPFGNRKITGYVVEITENPEFDVDKIKPLCNIVKGRDVEVSCTNEVGSSLGGSLLCLSETLCIDKILFTDFLLFSCVENFAVLDTELIPISFHI